MKGVHPSQMGAPSCIKLCALLLGGGSGGLSSGPNPSPASPHFSTPTQEEALECLLDSAGGRRPDILQGLQDLSCRQPGEAQAPEAGITPSAHDSCSLYLI